MTLTDSGRKPPVVVNAKDVEERKTTAMTVIRIGLCDVPVERECTGIECWYDRHYRHWVLYPIDAEGNQLDEARYGFGKVEATQMRRDMEAELIGKIY